VKYIDIPLQHVHPDTLRRMKRPWDGERYMRLFEKVRAAMPTAAVRTTFIVGFPGETQEEFASLIDFVKEARLDRVGAFVFSREPGTPSHDMEGQISLKVKRERYDQIMRVQQKISMEVNQSWVGKDLEVLIDEERDGWLIGRSHRDAPEIDGLVFVQGDAKAGDIVKTTVVQAEAYDLHARMEGARPMRRELTQLRQAAPARPL
jgi:ribosomal protein S12 methylthiotransferase